MHEKKRRSFVDRNETISIVDRIRRDQRRHIDESVQSTGGINDLNRKECAIHSAIVGHVDLR